MAAVNVRLEARWAVNDKEVAAGLAQALEGNVESATTLPHVQALLPGSEMNLLHVCDLVHLAQKHRCVPVYAAMPIPTGGHAPTNVHAILRADLRNKDRSLHRFIFYALGGSPTGLDHPFEAAGNVRSRGFNLSLVRALQVRA